MSEPTTDLARRDPDDSDDLAAIVRYHALVLRRALAASEEADRG